MVVGVSNNHLCLLAVCKPTQCISPPTVSDCVCMPSLLRHGPKSLMPELTSQRDGKEEQSAEKKIY